MANLMKIKYLLCDYNDCSEEEKEQIDDDLLDMVEQHVWLLGKVASRVCGYDVSADAFGLNMGYGTFYVIWERLQYKQVLDLEKLDAFNEFEYEEEFKELLEMKNRENT